MTSGYCTTIWNIRDHGASKINYYQPHQRPAFIQRRWWCIYGRIGSPLLWAPSGKQMIHSKKYCFQFDQLKAALKEKNLVLVNRKHIVFHQDNARLHISLMTRQKLLQLGWEGLIHLPYSPDTASSDFHLFQSFQNSLNGKFSIPWKIVRSTWNSFLLKKIKSFGKMEL